MTAQVQAVVEALRQELQQYGEMLALLDRQQEFVLARSANDLVDSIAVLNAQSGVIQAARKDREKARRNLASSLTLPEDASFATLIPVVHPDIRPLLGALVDENNTLLVRIQQRARQNHLMLTRSLELMQKLVASLMPHSRTPIYSGDGGLIPVADPTKPLYEAVG